MLHFSSISLLIFFLTYQSCRCEDSLTPYVNHHGPFHDNAFVKSCLPIEHGNLTHELYKADETISTSGVREVRYFSTKVGFDKHRVTGHIAIINNPKRWLTLMEPGGPGGCHDRRRETIVRSSEIYHCEAAINAGYFNTHTSQCLGNVVVNGRVVRDGDGIQNAHFGITREGRLFFGYISEQEVLSKAFTTLVGGVVWLLRRGQNYVRASALAECEKTEETGSMERFIGVRSARTAVGHDAKGRLLFAHVDGKTDQAGVNLYEFADLLRSFGVINAINLDGGGSSTFVINQTVVNYPSDIDSANNNFLKVRPVTTGLCVNSPACSIRSSVACAGLCLNNGSCNFTTGLCSCPPGYRGVLCEQRCPEGYWGRNCRRLCLCETCRLCHHVTGTCNATRPGCKDTNLKEESGTTRERDGVLSSVLLAVLVCIASLSVILNISLLCSRCKKPQGQRYQLLRTEPRTASERSVRFLNTLEEEEEERDSS